MNNVCQVGRLVADPELKYTPSGKPVVSFRIAVNDPYKKEEPKADFFNCQVWGKTAEFLANAGHKGNQISIVGRLQVRKWVNSDGVKQEKTEIVAEQVNLLEKKASAQPQAQETVRNDSDMDYDPFAEG